MTEDLIHTCGGMLLAGRLGEQVNFREREKERDNKIWLYMY